MSQLNILITYSYLETWMDRDKDQHSGFKLFATKVAASKERVNA